MPQLDAYNGADIDDEAEADAMSEGGAEAARQAAERELDRRDRRAAAPLPGAFGGALRCCAMACICSAVHAPLPVSMHPLGQAGCGARAWRSVCLGTASHRQLR
jgi:Mini-chromosome maintenance protein 2